MKPIFKGDILIVDDEETTRRSLADIFRLEGYSVHSVASGEDALACLGVEAVDLMILDLKMPGMDGLEVLRIVSQRAPDMMVILLTAYGSLESAVEALRHHAFDYLIKPVSPRQVLDSAERALAQRSERLHKHSLLEEMEASLRQLLETDLRPSQREQPLQTAAQMIYLGNGVMGDLDRREIWGGPGRGADRRVSLTATECKLLKVLLENGGKVLTHRELVVLVQGYEVTDQEAPEVLRPLVSRLRQKLANFPGGDQWITNVRGKGYVFERRGDRSTGAASVPQA
jgi:DNA-binding response OmpR family regulator